MLEIKNLKKITITLDYVENFIYFLLVSSISSSRIR
jgi:hypothetical protein